MWTKATISSCNGDIDAYLVDLNGLRDEIKKKIDNN